MANEIEFTEPGYKEVWLGDRFISRHRVQEEATESALRHAIENGPGDYRIVTPDRFVKVKFVVFKAPTTTAPSAPTGLVILSFDAGQAVLDWNNNSEPNLASYKVYHSENGITFDLVATVGVSTYTITGLAPAVTHYFKVQAFNSLGQESPFSEIVSGADITPPAIPTGLLVVSTTGTTVTLDWNNNTDSDFAYYRVYRSTNGTTWTLASGDLTNSVHVVTGLVSETLYYFHVRATDQSGNESAASSVVQGTTADITAPANATNFAILASSTTESTLFMTWTASVSSDVVGYKIYRSTDNVTYTLIATTGLVAFYEATGLSPTTLYYFKISAIDEVPNESALSSAISYTTAPNFHTTVPDAVFTVGTESYFDLSPYITPPAVTITQATGTALSTIGVTIDSANKQLDYDGVGSGNISGVSLTVASANTAASDWASRIATTDVVWYHDFSSSNEVRNFRWTGGVGLDVNDSGAQDVQYDATDGITGGCLKLISPASPSNDDSGWWRPFSPLVGGTTTGNGRGSNDPGAGITPRTWDTTNTNTTANHGVGYYGDPLYQDANFDGTDYWLQVRCKMSSEWWTQPVQDRTGKFLYLTSTKRSLTNQEIVTNAPSQSVAGMGGTGGSFYMYRSGSPPLQDDWIADGGADLSQVMPGGTCNFGTNPGSCWVFPPNEWVTLLYHVVLGRSEDGDTFIEVWGAHQGETSYTKIWEQPGIPLPYDADIPKGHNAILLSPGANEVRTGTITADMVMKVGQIIFRKGNGTSGTPLIACPQV